METASEICSATCKEDINLIPSHQKGMSNRAPNQPLPQPRKLLGRRLPNNRQNAKSGAGETNGSGEDGLTGATTQ